MKIKVQYFIYCILLSNLFFSNVFAEQNQDPALVQSMLSKYTLLTPQIQAKRHFFLDLALQNNLSLSEPGFHIGFGYRATYLGFDLRFTKGKNSFGEIRRLAQKDAYPGTDSNTEIDIARNKADLWNHWSFGPGFSVSDKFFSSFLSDFTERVRAAFEYGNYSDEVNNIPFQSYIFSVETSLLYQMNQFSPWSLNASLNWNSGMLVRDYRDSQLNSYGIPVSWIGCSLGLEYAF
jgi:hypothetical protein